MREPQIIRSVRSFITLLFAVSYLLNVFLRSPLLESANMILLLVVLVMSLYAATGSSRIIGVILIAVGIGLLACAQAPFEEWVRALRKNADLVVMFILISLIGIPVQHGGYKESLRALFAQHAHSQGGYYSLVSGMAAVIGSLISIASVPLTFEIARESRLGANRRLMGTALARGFITCMIWAPTSATIALVVSVTGAEWTSFAPIAIVCALMAECVGILLAFMRTASHEEGSENRKALDEVEDAPERIDVGKVVELAIFSVLLIVFIVLIAQLFGISVIVVVAMASLVWPLLWMIVIRRLDAYRKEFKASYLDKKLPGSKNQIVLFTGAGVLAQSIGYSGLGDVIVQALVLTTGQNVLLLTIAIVVIILLTCVLGIHPIVATAVIGGAIDPGACGISAAYLALTLSMSWALGNAVCPTSANVIAVSDMVKASPVEASVKWNGPYVIVTAAVLIAFMMFMRALGCL